MEESHLFSKLRETLSSTTESVYQQHLTETKEICTTCINFHTLHNKYHPFVSCSFCHYLGCLWKALKLNCCQLFSPKTPSPAPPIFTRICNEQGRKKKVAPVRKNENSTSFIFPPRCTVCWSRGTRVQRAEFHSNHTHPIQSTPFRVHLYPTSRIAPHKHGYRHTLWGRPIELHVSTIAIGSVNKRLVLLLVLQAAVCTISHRELGRFGVECLS